MKTLALALALASLDPALARLADAFARELLRTTGGESATIDLPSGAGAEEFRNRVETDLARSGAKDSKLRARGVLTESGDRLVASFRIEGRDGHLRDVVSVSTIRAPARGPAPAPLVSARNGIRIVASSRSPIEGPILALAELGANRLAALTPDAILLLRLDPVPTLEAREALEPPLQTMRAPAGILLSAEKDSLWVWTNRTGRSDLLSVDGHRASWGAQAASPPGFPAGLAYRAGTSLLESASLGPLVAWLPGDPSYAVDASGALLRPLPDGGEKAGIRIGGSLARLDHLVVASGPAPPGVEDQLLFLDETNLTVYDTIALPGTIRAIATGSDGIVVALESTDGFELLQLRVAR